jgi:predicted DNA-binding transcriptional regulator AlpA
MLPTSLDLDPSAIPISQIPAALSALAALQSALAARLMIAPAAAPASDVDKDNLLTVRECAQRLRRSTKWVYRRTKPLPFARCLGPHSWVFSEKGMEKWLAQRRAQRFDVPESNSKLVHALKQVRTWGMVERQIRDCTKELRRVRPAELVPACRRGKGSHHSGSLGCRRDPPVQTKRTQHGGDCRPHRSRRAEARRSRPLSFRAASCFRPTTGLARAQFSRRITRRWTGSPPPMPRFCVRKIPVVWRTRTFACSDASAAETREASMPRCVFLAHKAKINGYAVETEQPPRRLRFQHHYCRRRPTGGRERSHSGYMRQWACH